MKRNVQVTLLPGAAAIRFGQGNVAQCCFTRLNALCMALQNLNCLLLCPGNLGFPPAAGATALVVLDEQVAAVDHVFSLPTNLVVSCWRVVFRHVFLERLGIGVRRRFPARFLGRGVKVVGQVLGVRVTNFPA